MLAIIQFILATIGTVIYGIHLNPSFDLAGVLCIVLMFLMFNLIAIILIFVFFVIFIYATEKMSPTLKWKHYVTHFYNMYMFRFFYRVRLIVTGKENLPKNMNFVVYSNHIEYTDPLFIMQAYKRYPVGFVAKEPLFRFPVLRNLMYGAGCIPITRYADRRALQTIIKAIKQVKEGQPMGIFPEGKRTYQNELIEFKPGAFKLVQKAKADISPVCLYDMHELSLHKFRVFPVKVYLHILPVIPYEEHKDMDTVELSEHVYQVIETKLNEFKNH